MGIFNENCIAKYADLSSEHPAFSFNKMNHSTILQTINTAICFKTHTQPINCNKFIGLISAGVHQAFPVFPKGISERVFKQSWFSQ